MNLVLNLTKIFAYLFSNFNQQKTACIYYIISLTRMYEATCSFVQYRFLLKLFCKFAVFCTFDLMAFLSANFPLQIASKNCHKFSSNFMQKFCFQFHVRFFLWLWCNIFLCSSINLQRTQSCVKLRNHFAKFC